jgi:hypothetical protein
MGNFTLPRGPCNFLNLLIGPWEVLFLFLLCFSSLCHSFSQPAAALSERFFSSSLPLLSFWTGGSRPGALARAAPSGGCRRGSGGAGLACAGGGSLAEHSGGAREPSGRPQARRWTRLGRCGPGAGAGAGDERSGAGALGWCRRGSRACRQALAKERASSGGRRRGRHRSSLASGLCKRGAHGTGGDSTGALDAGGPGQAAMTEEERKAAPGPGEPKPPARPSLAVVAIPVRGRNGDGAGSGARVRVELRLRHTGSVNKM